MDTFSLEQIQTSAAFISEHSTLKPQLGLILGSGLGPLADEIEQATYIPYQDIPHFPESGVEGHVGRLVIGRLYGFPVLAMQGRVHFYEGYSPQAVTFPVRVMQALGIDTLIVTNAAGGLNPKFKVGELMLITDHLNMPGMAGHSPLFGPNLAEFGPRFSDMSTPYDLELQNLARRAATVTNVPLREGVYVCVAGPSYETPAEIRFLRGIGGDAVGMSTAPEVVVARHGGMRVLGISGIANIAISDPTTKGETTHAEVLAGSQVMAPRLISLVREILKNL